MKPIRDQTAQFLLACENIAAGDSIAQACRAAKVAERSFFKALAADGDGPLGRAYAVARRYRADRRSSEIEEYVRRACLPKDNPEHLDPNAARVAIDGSKWLASRENNGRYGDRLAVDTALPTKPALTREETLAQLHAAGLSVSDIFGAVTKPVQTTEALLLHVVSDAKAAEVMDCDV